LNSSRHQPTQISAEATSDTSISPALDISGKQEQAKSGVKESSTFPVAIERNAEGSKSKVGKTITKSPEQPEPLAKITVTKVKKKKTPRNEIDAIFDP